MQNTINAITELLTEYTSHSWKCLHGITSHNQTEEELQKIVDSQPLLYKQHLINAKVVLSTYPNNKSKIVRILLTYLVDLNFYIDFLN